MLGRGVDLKSEKNHILFVHLFEIQEQDRLREKQDLNFWNNKKKVSRDTTLTWIRNWFGCWTSHPESNLWSPLEKNWQTAHPQQQQQDSEQQRFILPKK